LAHGGSNLADGSVHSSIVGIPRLDDIWVGPPECLGQGDKREAIQYHGEGVTLGHSLTGEKDGAFGARLAPEDKLGGVTVAIGDELGTMGPPVADGPEQGFPTKLVEAIGSIHQEGTVWVFGVQVLSRSGGA